MKNSILHSMALLICATASLYAQGAFTYQGILTGSTGAYTGAIELDATLWDAATNGTQILPPRPMTETVEATNGLFTVSLDFGKDAFLGGPRWLQISLRTAPDPEPFTTLWPRQKITATPYAMVASHLTGVVRSENVIGGYSNPVAFANPDNFFAGQGSDLLNLNASQLTSGTVPLAALNNAWKITGNAGTTPGTHFLGTTDNQPLEVRVNGQRALRLEPTPPYDPGPPDNSYFLESVNIVGGYRGNVVSPGVASATIGGGGRLEIFSESGFASTNESFNRISTDFGTISGGGGNIIGPASEGSTIAGGLFNTVRSNSYLATIGGGEANILDSSSWSTIAGGRFNEVYSPYSTVGGGYVNTIQPDGRYSTIAGGYVNTIRANSAGVEAGTIGGGQFNDIHHFAHNATIAGGSFNSISESAQYATIGGGEVNWIHPNGHNGTIPGGQENSATNFAFAAGRRAKAVHTGAFVWADSQNAEFPSTAINQFSVRAGGGVRLVTDGAGATLDGQSILAGQVGPTEIADGSINMSKLTANSVSSGQLVNGSVSAVDVNAGSFSTTFWKSDGNAGTTPGTHFLGTSDNQPLELKVNGRRALRLEPKANDAHNVIGGASVNEVVPGIIGATIAGGGTFDPAATSYTNRVSGNFGTVGGGRGNVSSAVSATVGGGFVNIAGGIYATVSGGQNNSGSGVYATIPGGFGNAAGGSYSFAAGQRAQALHDGSFVWADSQTAQFPSTAINQFSVRAGGGVRFETAGAGATLDGQSILAGQVGSSHLVNGSVSAVDVNPASFSTTFWKSDGNAGTTPGTHFLGTTDNQPLEFKVNGVRALRLEPTASNDTVNVVGGSPHNFAALGVIGATIGGGAAGTVLDANSVSSDFGTIGGGIQNVIAVQSAHSTISGGLANGIGTNSPSSNIGGGTNNSISRLAAFSTIGGGRDNTIQLFGGGSVIGGGRENIVGRESGWSTIPGGHGNDIGMASDASTIGGGQFNQIADDSPFSTITGGGANAIGTQAWVSFIGGGGQNTIAANSTNSTIVAGNDNAIGTNSAYTVIAGGDHNTIGANSSFAIIPGGDHNFATNRAFAAGSRAKANHSGAFVWADSSFLSVDVVSTNANSVTMRAAGGYRLFSSSGTAGVFLAPGSGSWSVMSDRHAKENFAPVNAQAVLDKVAALPLTTWNYKTQSDTVRHIGPMAQDFKAAFHVGETDTGISSVDADGVALAAIQGLNQKVEEQASQLRAKEAEVRSLQERLNKVEELLGKLTSNNEK